MKRFSKLLAVSTIATTAFTFTPAITSTVDAAEKATITDIVFSYDGNELTVSYEQFSDAQFGGSGGVLKFFDKNPEIHSVGLENGSYVDYEIFVDALFDSSDDSNSLEVLGELSTNSENTMTDSEISAFIEVSEFGDDGEPVLPEAVVPEVISID
ncbi:hypothetical protein GLW08_10370 [Pontibacillus yanchengensis]|uniref:Uncharacterized protein n=2 Tax=Pontibacillus yanchengensis TaxID=462910 RepID=A0ACC7VHZ0_9BACI|nr:hypothetical protein [Pontibacillus yanchengensis]MYL34269.1 hypothetical protein [Pontibacillus yanchengensis]MYL53740.1 hypothetical protein [Pontibacillus yanchengensis]